MRKIFLLLVLLACQLYSNAQTKLQVVQDSVRVANGELIIRNASKNVQGMLYNKGNGTTEFRKIKLQNANDSVSIVIGNDSVNFSLQGNGAGSVYNTDPDVLLSRTAISSTQMKLKWWKSSNDLYQSPRIGIIGDSQGEGVYPSSYSQSIMGRFQQFVYGVASNAGVTNYSKSGYNSRQLSPTGSNAYVDNARNISKALADGNKIIVLCNTSNDFSTAGAGGYSSVAEYMSNTLLIADACDKAGATLFVISPFPRNEYSAAVRDSMRVLSQMLNQKFNSRFVYAYHLVENPAIPTTLLPSLQTGDGIHLNDEGSRIVFEALRDVMVSYYTSNAQVKNYQVQRAASYNHSFSTVATVTAINAPEWQVAADSLFYRVRIAYRNGYYSKWSNIVQGTKALPDTIYNQPPLVVSISPVIIYLPQNSTTLNVSASDANVGGSVSSYNWKKVQGGAFTISDAAVAKPTVSGLQEGTYIFRCEVKNSLNLSSYADVQVIVRVYESSLAVSKFNFNYSAQNISGWIDVSGGPFGTAANTWTDNFNNRSLATLGTSTALWGADFYNNASNTNGEVAADPGGFIIPASVIRSGWYSNGRVYTGESSNQMKFTNLSPTKTYRIKFYGSLVAGSGLDADPTVYIVKNHVLDRKQVNAVGNTSGVVVFRNVVPTPQGEIPWFVGVEQNRSQYGMLNAVSIEEDTLSPVNMLPQVTGVDRTIAFPMNVSELTASATDPDGAVISIAWTKISGPSGAVITNPNALISPVSFTTPGTYIFRCSVTDDLGGVGTADVEIQYNGASSNPTLYVGVGPSAYTQDGWTVLSGVPHANVATTNATLPGYTNTITISTVATANWIPLFSAASADTTGEQADDGGGLLAQPSVQRGAFFNLNGYDVAKPQIELTGLPAGTYKVTMLGSLKTSVAEFLYADCQTEYRVGGSSSVVTINTKGNTSHPAVFNNVTVGSGGSLKLYFNPVIASSNSYIGMLNFFIVEKMN